jgi:translation initiation factor IF-2
MSSITVAEFASELKKTPDVLLEQLKSAGLDAATVAALRKTLTPS